MKKSVGSYSKHSRALKAPSRVSVAKLLRTFPEGAKVRIRVNPQFRGAPHLRFNYKMGEIIAKRGNAFELQIADGGKHKTLYIKNVHLEPA